MLELIDVRKLEDPLLIPEKLGVRFDSGMKGLLPHET